MYTQENNSHLELNHLVDNTMGGRYFTFVLLKIILSSSLSALPI